MTDEHPQWLTMPQLDALSRAFHLGSAQASTALASWLGRPSVVELDSLEQVPLEQASELLLVSGDEPLCFCAATVEGSLTGELILAFDDASGWALADLVLEQSRGVTRQWTELATSVALETTNIVCCAYLNALAESCPGGTLLPSPPRFNRDFAASLLEFALMEQALVSDQVLVARTRFTIDEVQVNWTLLFIPQGDGLHVLPNLLTGRVREAR